MTSQLIKTWEGIGLALVLGTASSVGETIHIHQSYTGPWKWKELTMETSTQSSGGYSMTVYKGTAAITGYTGNAPELAVPEKISWTGDVEGGGISSHFSYEVEVREIWHLGGIPATSVIIPSTVTNLDVQAFCACPNLTSVVIPGSVKSIGLLDIDDYAGTFGSCPVLQSVSIGEGVEIIGTFAFADCGSLSSITIPESVKYIGYNTFYRCTNLTSIAVPNSSIGDRAFESCTSLKSAFLGEGVQNLEEGAFLSCSNLATVTILGNVTNDWRYSPFEGCTNVTTLVLGEKMSKIGDRMFDDLPRLQSITIPDNVTNIGTEAFYRCSGATTLSIGQKVKSIGSSAFSGCSSLATLAIPENVTDIGAGAFSSCIGLKTATIGNGVTDLGASAFSSCTGLVTLAVGSGIKTWGSSVFSGCTALSAVTLAEGLKGIGNYAFGGCYRLRKLEFPASLEEVGARAFSGCTALGTVGLGGVKRIGDQAFSGCTALKEAVLPESARSIGAGAFQGCTALGAVAFPAGVDAVDAGAFSGASVKTLLFDNAEGAFLEDFSKESLRTLSLGSHARGVTGARLADCTALALVLVDKGNGEYKVDGTGALYDKTGAELIKYPAGLAAEKVTVPATVRRVGERAFAHAMSLKEVEFLGPVDSIGEGAFDWCLALERVVFPAGVGQIGAGAFRVCPSLETLRFEGSGHAVPAFGGGQFAYAKPVVQIEGAETSRWASTLAELGLAYELIEEEGGAATTSTPVAVPHTWLERKAGRILAENGGDYEAAALAVASNGVDKVWQCYVAGLEPEEAGDGFTTGLSFSSGAPVVSWEPDLNEGGRKKEREYVVEGKAGMMEEWGATNAESRFFRVKVGMP